MSAANLVGDGRDHERGEAAGGLISGRYRIDQVLGRGSTATAYSARDDVTGQRRALKLFTPGNAAADRRATEEFRRLHELSHPSVVRVWDLARTAGGAIYLVTDEVQGPPLISLAQMSSTTERQAAFERSANDLADALAYLHGRGVIHGDISPGNIRFDASGRAVLFDFDLAGPGSPSVAHGGASGTLGYASPEALVGQRGPAGDLFALGQRCSKPGPARRPSGSASRRCKRCCRGGRRCSRPFARVCHPRGTASSRACWNPAPRIGTRARASCCAR